MAQSEWAAAKRAKAAEATLELDLETEARAGRVRLAWLNIEITVPPMLAVPGLPTQIIPCHVSPDMEEKNTEVFWHARQASNRSSGRLASKRLFNQLPFRVSPGMWLVDRAQSSN